MICITYLLFSAFVSAPLGQQINQYLKSSDISDSFKFWPKFNKTGLHYSKSIKKVGIQVQNGFPLNQFNKISAVYKILQRIQLNFGQNLK